MEIVVWLLYVGYTLQHMSLPNSLLRLKTGLLQTYKNLTYHSVLTQLLPIIRILFQLSLGFVGTLGRQKLDDENGVFGAKQNCFVSFYELKYSVTVCTLSFYNIWRRLTDYCRSEVINGFNFPRVWKHMDSILS